MTVADANRLLDRGRFVEAEAICRQVLNGAPRNLDALHLLGTILHQRGDWQAAIEVMQRAIALAPEAPSLRVNLAALLRPAFDHTMHREPSVLMP